MRIAMTFGLCVLAVSVNAQTLKSSESGGTYEKSERALLRCLSGSASEQSDKACADAALDRCLNAGIFEACLDSLHATVMDEVDLLARALGPDSSEIGPPECETTSVLDPTCGADFALKSLMDLRQTARTMGIDLTSIEPPFFHAQPILQCIDAAPGPSVALHCVGEGALACWHGEEGAGPTTTIDICLNAELDYWTRRLDLVLSTLNPGPALQIDWERSRDSRCALVAEIWKDRTGAATFMTDCLVQLTGQHVLWLEEQGRAR